MDILKTFISLTDYTYGFGEEAELLPKLPKDLKEDSQGNYYMEIGETESMFCCHLDTAAWEKEKVTHDVFTTKKGDTGVGTSGDTILGADDKAGVVILMNMIEHNIPGLYYFFIGEESGGVGSKGIVRREPKKFEKYKRCIAFDRRDYGSIITKQMGRACCSEKFADALIAQFDAANMPHKQDPFGVYTDSANFVDIISECTNLSVGYFNEHSISEVINITYLEELCEATLKVKWEELPAVREIKSLDSPNPVRGQKRAGDLDDDTLEEIFFDVDDLLEEIIHMYCFNFDNFMPEKEMIYLDYYNDYRKLSVYIHENGSITIGKSKFETYEHLVTELKKYHNFNLEKIQSKRKKSEEEEEVPSNADEYHDWITKSSQKDEEPPWWTQENDDEFNDDDDINIDYFEITNNVQYKDLGKSFTKGMDIQDFIFEVLSVAYEKGTKYILPEEMIKILNSKNKTKESFIMWLKDRGNNPDKTYGLSWNQGKRVFQIDVDDLQ
jgi:hypothetical protein